VRGSICSIERDADGRLLNVPPTPPRGPNGGSCWHRVPPEYHGLVTDANLDGQWLGFLLKWESVYLSIRRMTPNQIRWAEALALELQMGDEASTWIAHRIVELSRAGDKPAVEHMMEIAERLDQLSAGRSEWAL
jgi:hypothetical protein